MDQRLQAITLWADQIIDQPVLKLSPASADASFRRYFRVQTKSKTYIIMDAPPDKEPLAPFLDVDAALRAQGVHAPEIIALDATQGFLLIEDLGTQTYLDSLVENPDSLYRAAITALVKIQQGGDHQPAINWAAYDADRLQTEMALFDDWYLRRHLKIEPTAEQAQCIKELKLLLVEHCLQQPQIWVHRDYHSRNLMVVAEHNPGVIDFQDMVVGPLAYDVASLFKDCYIRWPRERQLQWCEEYLAELGAALPDLTPDLDQFVRWYDFTGLQRHLKVLGIFCRLCYRDGKSNYLQDLPLVADYIDEVLELYPEFASFRHFFRTLPEPPTTARPQ